MFPSNKTSRRGFFAAAIAFIAAVLTPKPKTTTLGTAPASSETTIRVSAYMDRGHMFYEWYPDPRQPVAYFLDRDGLHVWPPGADRTMGLQFHRDAFTLTTEPAMLLDNGYPIGSMVDGINVRMEATPEDAEYALRELNAMMDRWATEPWRA